MDDEPQGVAVVVRPPVAERRGDALFKALATVRDAVTVTETDLDRSSDALLRALTTVRETVTVAETALVVDCRGVALARALAAVNEVKAVYDTVPETEPEPLVAARGDTPGVGAT